jgi:DNA-binding transcriptional LysR family regulator
LEEKYKSVDGMAVLVAIVRTSSFSRAASALGITQSGASKLLSRLEQRLGVPLLQRTTRAMQLTEIGKLYYEGACRVLAEIDGLEREVTGHPHHPQGRIALTAPAAFGELLMPIVVGFQQHHPDVTVEIDLADRLVDLGAEPFDLAIRVTDQPPASCVAHVLALDRRTLCASPAYLQNHRAPARPADLADHRCIAFVPPNGPSRWYLRRELAGPVEPFSVSGTVALNDIIAVRQAAIAGLGIADLPVNLVESQLTAGQLVPVLVPYVPVRRTIYALYPTARLLPARTRAFIEAVETSFRARRQPSTDHAAAAQRSKTKTNR